MTDKMTAEQALMAQFETWARDWGLNHNNYFIPAGEGMEGPYSHYPTNCYFECFQAGAALTAPRVPDSGKYIGVADQIRSPHNACMFKETCRSLLTDAPAPADDDDVVGVRTAETIMGHPVTQILSAEQAGKELAALRERLESSDTSPQEIKQRVDLRLENIKLRERVKVLEAHMRSAVLADMADGCYHPTAEFVKAARLRGGSDE
jgi:hypothetical protein